MVYANNFVVRGSSTRDLRGIHLVDHHLLLLVHVDLDLHPDLRRYLSSARPDRTVEGDMDHRPDRVAIPWLADLPHRSQADRPGHGRQQADDGTAEADGWLFRGR